MVKDNHLTIIDENGEEVLCEILFTHESKEFNKNYVLFYPVGSEEEEEIEVLAAAYVPEGDGIGELHAIETDEEWEMIEQLLAQFEEDQEFYDLDLEDDYDEDFEFEFDEEDDDFEDDEHDDDCGCH